MNFDSLGPPKLFGETGRGEDAIPPAPEVYVSYTRRAGAGTTRFASVSKKLAGAPAHGGLADPMASTQGSRHDPSPDPAPELLTNTLRLDHPKSVTRRRRISLSPSRGEGQQRVARPRQGVAPLPEPGRGMFGTCAWRVPSMDSTQRNAGRRPGAGPGEGLCLEPQS